LGPCGRHRIATRARICSTDFCTYACGGLEDSAKIAKYSDEWYLSRLHRVAELVRKASTHRYLSFDPVTEHIASEMRLVLRSEKGKGRVRYRACLDLPPAACPTVHGVRQMYARMQGGLTLPDATYYSSADRSAVLDEYGIRIQQLCMLARMSAAAANSTAHAAIAVEATMARLSRSDARQPQQLPKCVDRPMAWVRKECYRP
jgi:hypothetical protein